MHYVIFLGVGIALASAVIGLYVSYHAEVASGAAIVLVATAFFAAALVFAPRRGLVARWRLESRAARFEVRSSSAE
jgi:ABC-type Mn2+/Zn2+ transport system permease subunit